MIKKINQVLPAIILTVLFYYLATFALLLQKSEPDEFPTLRARLGTILHHSSDYGGSEHLYCYYPPSSKQYDNKQGEYILRRVADLADCQDWHGAVVFEEGSWVSEKEKIWWSRDQKDLELAESVITSNSN